MTLLGDLVRAKGFRFSYCHHIKKRTEPVIHWCNSALSNFPLGVLWLLHLNRLKIYSQIFRKLLENFYILPFLENVTVRKIFF